MSDSPNLQVTEAGSKADIEADIKASAAVVADPASPEQALLCTYSMATDVTPLPESARRIALPSYGTLLLGRSHQADLFERLLGRCSALLSCVSRVHLSLTINHKQPSFIEVSNLSVHAVQLSGKIIKHGERATVEAPAEISLLKCTHGTDPKALLSFTLWSKQPEDLSQVRVTKTPAEEEIVIEVPPALIQETAVAATQRPDFCLEIGGTAVLATLPLESRRVLPKVGRELVIGRWFQAQLFLEGICEAALKWVSRAHFRIECGVDGKCNLVLLSKHPAWLLRSGRREQAKQRQALAIQRGDLILLYMGASDGSADGVDGAGTLHLSCSPL